VSSFKVRLLADQIRGKFVSEALDILNFSKKSSSKNLKKLLESAIANAEHNNGLDIDNLFISEISVDDAFLLKRIRPRARGRADRIQKRSCHINLSLNTRGI
jgi:large subunit ribosomal protein L22